MNKTLHEHNVPSVIAQRRDDFLSAQFKWLVAVLRQLTRPLDRRNFAVLIEAFNRVSGLTVSVQQVITEAEMTGRSYLGIWLETAGRQPLKPSVSNLLALTERAAADPSLIKTSVDGIFGEIAKEAAGSDSNPDLEEDMAAWREISRDIASHLGKNVPLDQFLQELQLRSKEPTPKLIT